MKVTCNRLGGFNLGGLALHHGENEITREQWEAAAAKAPPRWLKAVCSDGPRGEPPELVLWLEDATPPTAREKIDAVKACDDIGAVERMAEGETRKTVLAAIDDRIGELESQAKQ